MLSILVAVISLLALAASLYKDRKLEPDTPPVKRALRVHHSVQAVLVCLALWAAIDSENSTKRYRAAQLDAEAATAAAAHTTEIRDTYILELLPAGPIIRNYDSYQGALMHVPPEIRMSRDWKHQVSPTVVEQRIAGLRAFAKLQSIARKVIGEQERFGDRYPDALTKWAMRTLELQEADLGDLLSNSHSAMTYAHLVGQATGVTVAKYRNAVKRQEE